MRQIGVITNSEQAERFADHLRAQGTACSIDRDADRFRVWVHDDDRVAAAKEELPQFLAEPNHPRYQDAQRRAMKRIRADLDRRRQAQKNTVILNEKWSRPAAESCPMTIGLIAISIVVAYFIGFESGNYDPRVDQFWFSTDGTLRPILRGEVWRLVAPIFLHGDFMHILFNMLWIRQFGMQVEYRLGTPKFLGMVLVIAVLSNFAQFFFQGPNFCGMSGVVYGLFGYIWVKAKLEPDSGFDMPPRTVTMMLVWHVLCLIGVIPNIANWVHGVGLVVGVGMAMSRSLIKSISKYK